MAVLMALVAGFGAAALAPVVHRAFPSRSGLILSMVPLALLAYFASLWPSIARGEVLLEVHPWASLLGVRLSLRVDGLSLILALLITGIGALVTLYAGQYLEHQASRGRFFLLLLSFMASMLGVVLCDNLLALFVFWELTSVTSYLLIGFRHEQEDARAFALQGLFVTVAGGQALLLGLLLLGATAGFELSALPSARQTLQDSPLYPAMVVLILGGAFTKSAQFPFHFWLPRAMVAPTPVSAYLHSATMVKAGVYLLLRLSPSLGGSALWELALTVTGAITMLLGGYRALGERDLKRILAYATISVLGLLVFLIGLGTAHSLQAAVLYLVAHALYKGTLFLAAGAVDHATGTRDVVQLGGLYKAMPLTALAVALGALSMAGLLPALGFVAKETVYAAVLEAPSRTLASAVTLLAFIPLVAAALILSAPLLGPPRPTAQPPHEGSWGLWGGPLLLGSLGLVLGVFPGLLDPLLGQAVGAVSLNAGQVSLKLWPGFHLALLLSVVSLAVGALAYRFRHLAREMASARLLARIATERAYDVALSGMLWVAGAQTRLLQSGYLRRYLLVSLLAVGGPIAFVLFSRAGVVPRLDFGGARAHEVGLAVLMALSAGAAVSSRSRLGSVAAMGMVGFGVALMFLYFGAPDLALTQFIVEALTVVVFLLALFHLPRFEQLSSPPTRVRDLVVAVGGGLLMSGLVLLANQHRQAPSIAGYYLESALPAGHGRNVVNVILVDFRALDTLGEITVLAVAALGVHSLLGLGREKASP